MLKTARYIIVRFLLSFIVVAAAYFAVVWYPDYSALQRIHTHVSRVTDLRQTLSTVGARVQSQGDLASVKISDRGAIENYATQLGEIAGEANIGAPPIPGHFSQLNNDEQITHFSQITQPEKYQQALNEAAKALQNDRALLTHQRVVIQALANLLAYQPSTDLSSQSTDTLSQHLSAAVAGLEKTLERLGSAPNYDDPSLQQIVTQVHGFQNTAESLSKNPRAISRSDISSFSSAVTAAQQAIVANRQAFWTAQKALAFKRTNAAEETIRLYLQQLYAL